MQDVLSELFKETNYLDPYLRQFLKYLKGKEVFLIGKDIEFLKKKIDSMGFISDISETLKGDISKKYDGIILFNSLIGLDTKYMPQLFENALNNLQDEGFLFIVIRNNKDSDPYNKEYLDVVMGKNYNFIEELSNYDNLKFYIYAKKHY